MQLSLSSSLFLGLIQRRPQRQQTGSGATFPLGPTNSSSPSLHIFINIPSFLLHVSSASRPPANDAGRLMDIIHKLHADWPHCTSLRHSEPMTSSRRNLQPLLTARCRHCPPASLITTKRGRRASLGHISSLSLSFQATDYSPLFIYGLR